MPHEEGHLENTDSGTSDSYNPFGMITATGETIQTIKDQNEQYEKDLEAQKDAATHSGWGSLFGGLLGVPLMQAVLGTTLGPAGIALAAGGGAWLGGKAGQWTGENLRKDPYRGDFDRQLHHRQWASGREDKLETELEGIRSDVNTSINQSAIKAGAGAAGKSIWADMREGLSFNEALMGHEGYSHGGKIKGMFIREPINIGGGKLDIPNILGKFLDPNNQTVTTDTTKLPGSKLPGEPVVDPFNITSVMPEGGLRKPSLNTNLLLNSSLTSDGEYPWKV